jgi:hypothetical protein
MTHDLSPRTEDLLETIRVQIERVAAQCVALSAEQMSDLDDPSLTLAMRWASTDRAAKLAKKALRMMRLADNMPRETRHTIVVAREAGPGRTQRDWSRRHEPSPHIEED